MGKRTDASLATAAIVLAGAAITSCSARSEGTTVAGTAAAKAVKAACNPLPFAKPSVSKLRASGKKAFAYYFPPFPISVDNKDPAKDQYTSWLNPAGSNGMYAGQGGYLRDRPLYTRAARSASNWRQLDFQVEIKQAIQMGLDGFIFEYHTGGDTRFAQLPAMLAAARAVDPGFRIMLSPDFPTAADASPDKVVSDVLKVKDDPSVYRLADGRIVLAPFYPERHPTSWWDSVHDKLAAKGVKTAFVPVFLSWNGSDKADWNSHLYGYASWGARWAGMTDSYRKAGVAAHARKRIWMSPVAFEDVRPKDKRFWEPSNSALLRTSFEKAMAGNADWVSLMTWNDYTESWVAPSKERGWAVADVSTYYTTWFKTGKAPAITQDALYYFHRSQRTDAPYDKTKQTIGPITVKNGDPATNDVELLAFLKSPGKLVIKQGSNVKTMTVTKAGMVSFKVPIVPGTTPVFQLQRSGKTVRTVTSKTPIRAKVTYQDLINHAGGGTTCAHS
jgi:hypothetical protein